MWVAWRDSQGFDAATVTPAHIKRYRQALLEAGYIPITIRWKLTIVRRFYEAASNAGLRTDNPAAGVKSPRLRQATEDFKYLCDDQLAEFLTAIPDPDKATGREKIKRLRDLLMVSPMSLQALRTIAVHRAKWGVGLAKDILVWTKTEFEKRLHLRASLPSIIMLEGKLLYAA